jgi:dipeptidyl aminopeptidase/acylaminoacyl peptidase
MNNNHMGGVRTARLPLTLLTFILLLIFYAQAPPPNPLRYAILDKLAQREAFFVSNTKDFTLEAYDLSKNRLGRLDLPRGPRPDMFNMSRQMDLENQQLYLLQRPEVARTPQPSRIVRLDILTGEQEVIYEATEIYTIELSPDKRKLAVSSFPRGFKSNLSRTCILDLETEICEPVIFEEYYRFSTWVDESSFILTWEAGSALYLADITNLVPRKITAFENWLVHDLEVIPNTQKVLLSVTDLVADNTPQLVILDLETLNLTDCAFDSRYGHSYISISPDGRYLLESYSRNTSLVDFQTGNLIAEFTASNAHWLPDSKTVVAAHRVNDDLLQIFKVDAQTGLLEVLLETPKTVGVVVP